MIRTTLIVSLFLLVATTAFAGDFKEYSAQWLDDNAILSKFDSFGPEKGTTGVREMAYCEGWEKGNNTIYGSMESAFSTPLAGAAVSRKMSYASLCMGLIGVKKFATADDLRKLAFILGDPLVAANPTAPEAMAAIYVMGNISNLGLKAFLEVDKSYGNEARRSQRYQKLFVYLVTGDTKGMLTLIRSIPDKDLETTKLMARYILSNQN